MKIIEITVKYQIKDEKEEAAFLSLLACGRRESDMPQDKGVGEVKALADKVKPAKEPYVPSCERTKLGLVALGKCSRVSVIDSAILERWATAYPHVDLAAEISACEAWAESKGVTRTPRGWQACLNTWLRKQQDKTRGTNVRTNAPQSAAVTPVEPETAAWIKAAAA